MRREEKDNFVEVDIPRRKIKKEHSGEKRQRSKRFRNKEFARVTYAFVVLFLALMCYIVYFNIVRAKTIVNSPYNQRQDAFADRIIRGTITDRAGNVLAETQVTEDGTEVRNYPYGPAFAHVVGYSNSHTGKSGLESVENFELLTSNSFFLEKIANDFKGQKNMGDTVVTTLDANLQQAAYNALGDNKGGIVVMEASTGKILAMVSGPTFDPNTIEESWDYLNADDSESPLLNRTTQGAYAPGSTFKVITALEFMRQYSDYESYTYECSGQIEKDGTTIPCFNGNIHGHEDLRASLANSCNASFANIGLMLDKTAYRQTLESLLFNKKLPCVFDYSKSLFQITKDSGTAEMMMTAMGQGKTMTSPYHMALITSAIANGGVLMEPYLVEKVTNHRGSQIRKNVPRSYKKLMSVEESSRLKSYMNSVIDEGITATALQGLSYSVAGKTGTAEYSLTDENKSHSWFIGFTNVDNPELVISVVIEGNDGDLTTNAVPIARQVLDAYYN